MCRGDYCKQAAETTDDEIEILEICRRVWLCRRWVMSVVVVSLFLGGIIAAVMPEEYEAVCEMVPQGGSNSGQGHFSSLAALAGINLGYADEENALSPHLYENIVSSVAFRKELLQNSIYSVRERAFRRLDSYLMDGWQKEWQRAEYDTLYRIDAVSRWDYNCMRALERRVTLVLDDQKGSLLLSVRMPERLVAAQVAQAVVLQLERYVTEFKIEKVQSNLEFVEQRYIEARRDFERIQLRRARFRDANRNTTRYAAQTELERLDAEYDVALNLYNELAMQLEQAKIKVKETMPVLAVINPVTVPYKRSKPRKMVIVLCSALVGFAVGVLSALLIPVAADITGSNWLHRILPKAAYKGLNRRTYDALDT